MNKKYIYLIGIFLIILVGAIEINYFTGFSSPENLTFAGNENITRNITIFNDGVVSSAFMNLSSSDLIEGDYTKILFDTTGSGNANTYGITQNGTYFWTTDITNDEVYKFFINGTYTGDSFDTSAGGLSNPYDITQNGTYFWITDSGVSVHKYWMNGTYVGDTFVSGGNSRGITNNGTYMWIIDTDKNVREHWMNGTATGFTFTISETLAPYGITQNGTYFWVVDFQNDIIFKYWMNGTYTNENFTTSVNSDMITIYNNYFWITDASDKKIYQYYLIPEYPTNLSIKINNANIWSYTGEFNQTDNQTSDFSATLNTALNSGACDCTGCVLNGTNCIIETIFHSDTAGILEYSNINITWNESTSPTSIISEPSGEKLATGFSYSINATDNYQLDFCTYWVMRGASLEIENTTVNCSSSITGTDTVSSIGTNYTFYFFTNDTSGNSNTSSSAFSVALGGQVSGGGGSGTTVIVGNGETGWTMESRKGFSRFDISMPIGTRRELAIILTNTGSESRNIKLSCEDKNGSVCKYVSFPENPISLTNVKNQETRPPFIIIIPENAELGDFIFNIVGTDDLSRAGSVSVFIEIKESGFLDKLFSRTEGGFPYLIIFLGVGILSFLFSMIILGILKIPLRVFISIGSSILIASVIVIVN